MVLAGAVQGRDWLSKDEILQHSGECVLLATTGSGGQTARSGRCDRSSSALSRCGRFALRSASNTCYERLDTPRSTKRSVLMAISSTMSAGSRATTRRRSFTPVHVCTRRWRTGFAPSRSSISQAIFQHRVTGAEGAHRRGGPPLSSGADRSISPHRFRHQNPC